MSSVAQVNSGDIANGYALNQKVNLDYVRGASGNTILDSLIRGFFRKGGMQVQFNIVDAEILLDAKKHPEQYRDLVVRVSGYSSYFADLTPEMQDEIIARSEQSFGGEVGP